VTATTAPAKAEINTEDKTVAAKPDEAAKHEQTKRSVAAATSKPAAGPSQRQWQ
jgi:hypothetical protein